jgi:hypothetical protein
MLSSVLEANRNGTPTEDYEDAEHAIPTSHHTRKGKNRMALLRKGAAARYMGKAQAR